MNKSALFKFSLGSLVLVSCLSKTVLSQAQITSDGTLPTHINVENNRIFTITGGRQIGDSLFHSFYKFSIPKEGAATFNNSKNIRNIFANVTGGFPSHIDGLIQAKGNSNLFLLNPSGIIFKSDAKLNIGGSFVATTANQINFNDGTFFSTTKSEVQPLLTVSVPSGLQFGKTSGNIAIEGSGFPGGLQVKPNKTIALVGGDVFLRNGGLFAPGARIEIGSVADSSLVSITPVSEGWALGYTGAQSFKSIYLTDNGFISTTGESSGEILLRGKKITITKGSGVQAISTGTGLGRAVKLIASESVEVSHIFNDFPSGIFTFNLSTGVSGDIVIETKKLIVRDRAFIDASSQGNGRGGNLTVNASDLIEIDGGGGLSRLTTQTFGSEDAGNLSVTTKKLVLRDGGQIDSSTRRSTGNGGVVSMDVLGSLEVTGQGILEDGEVVPSGLFAVTTGENVKGDGGRLTIKSERLVVQDGGKISVAAVEGSIGQPGDLNIVSRKSVVVSGAGSTLLAESESPEPAGDLAIYTDKLTVQDGAEVSVSGEGAGPAGDLIIKANSVFLDGKGRIQASTTSGQGGNIDLQSNDILLLRRNSQISATAGVTGNGGNIDIDAGIIAAIPKENSDILATAVRGKGGNIQINAQGVFGIEPRQEPSPFSDIDASSDLGVDGTIDIQTLTIDPSQGLVSLPAVPADPSRLIAQSCSVREGVTARKLSQFVVTGRGGVPASPYEALSSDAVLTNWAEPDQSSQLKQDSQAAHPTPDDSATTKPSPELVEAQGWVKTPDGQVMLVAQAPTATPHSSGLAQPSCPGS